MPTTKLHQKYIGEIMISVLLLQDIIAILIITFLLGADNGHNLLLANLFLLGKLTGLILAAFLIVKFIIIKLFQKFDIIHEYVFIMAIGWCLSLASIANLIGLSYEIGAFIAGISLASSKVALYIVDKLKPLRNFFVILFFFSIGARFDFLVTRSILLPGIILAALLLIVKPYTFRFTFKLIKETHHISKEIGLRLGQSSEFALIMAAVGVKAGSISKEASFLIQIVVILTFIISTYLVSLKYPTPIAQKAEKHKD
jgi:Kef-type K+ transport system membrane component KefB